MKLGFSMDIKQAQKLHMTQELKQGIEILQMNIQEVELLIVEALDENPVLEAEWGEDIDWSRFVASVKADKSNKYYDENDYHEDEINPDNYLGERLNLYDHLVKEVSGIELNDTDHKIAWFIIEQANDSGYFTLDIKACADELKISKEHFIAVLKKIQNIEPAGLLARSLKECLLLQIDQNDSRNSILIQMINEDLENIAQRKYLYLKKKYKLSDVKLGDMIQKIRSLDPKPGKKFSSFDPQYILPDVIVENNGFETEVIDNRTLPKLYINDLYHKILNETDDLDAQDFIRTRLNKAIHLIRNIEHRKNTIHKVAEQIVFMQKDYFEKEKSTFTPMRLKDISKATGFHESTISRTVNGKYMLTPKGLFEFKYFFSSSINNEMGQEISNKDIKVKIKDLIKEEDKKKPLSDQRIVDLLKSEGIDISRRTVAKYREELQIRSSSQRKEL